MHHDDAEGGAEKLLDGFHNLRRRKRLSAKFWYVAVEKGEYRCSEISFRC